MVLTTEPAAVPVVSFFCVVGIGSDASGFGAEVTLGVVGAADTVEVVGTLVEGVYGIVSRPETTFAETTVKHTGLPERAESIVTVTGRVPNTGDVGTSTWTRSIPEASILRVITWNGSGVFPTEPRTATYAGSEPVRSKE